MQNPNSPFFDGSGFEAAHISEIEKLEGDFEKIAELISDLPNDKHCALVASINKSLSGFALFAAQSLCEMEDCHYELAVAKTWGDLPVNAHLIVEEAISDYAKKELLER